jgi:hypothetical protein
VRPVLCSASLKVFLVEVADSTDRPAICLCSFSDAATTNNHPNTVISDFNTHIWTSAHILVQLLSKLRLCSHSCVG